MVAKPEVISDEEWHDIEKMSDAWLKVKSTEQDYDKEMVALVTRELLEMYVECVMERKGREAKIEEADRKAMEKRIGRVAVTTSTVRIIKNERREEVRRVGKRGGQKVRRVRVGRGQEA